MSKGFARMGAGALLLMVGCSDPAQPGGTGVSLDAGGTGDSGLDGGAGGDALQDQTSPSDVMGEADAGEDVFEEAETADAMPPPVNPIPEDRRIDWSEAGVKGDIPERTTLCATLSPVTGDNAAAIQAAITNCPAGQVVKLNAGTFNISKGLVIKSGVTLRGAGMGVTILKNTVAVDYLAAFLAPNASVSKSTAYGISGGNEKGSTSITTAAAHGWAVGDIILIDELQQPEGDPPITATGQMGPCTWCGRQSGTRPVGQLARLTAVPTPTTATLELPLSKTYDQSPEGIKLLGVTSAAGLEDVTLDSTAACTNDNHGIFSDNFSESSWLLRVEMKQVCRAGLKMAHTYRNTIRGCYIHETEHHTPNGGYLLWMMSSGSANLIEDNIIYSGLAAVIYNGALSGNVFAYNYLHRMWSTDSPGRGTSGFTSHGAHAMMNLFEGNFIDGPIIKNDFIWGSTSHATYYRNRQRTDTSPEPPVNALYGVQFFANATYMNLVGNVFGTVGYETAYQTANVYDQKKGIYFFQDDKVANTALRHGNWDSVNQGVVWDPAISAHTLPASLYRSAKPVFWGSEPWPPYGPETGISTNKLPAQARFESMAP